MSRDEEGVEEIEVWRLLSSTALSLGASERRFN